MSARFSNLMRRCAWSAVGVLAAAVAAGFLPRARSEAAGPDARIAFYQQRLGGPGSYPSHARLGLAYLQKFRETGRIEHQVAAERHVRQSFAYQPNFEALLGLAAVSLADHDFGEALDRARQAVDTMPGHPEAEGLLFDATLGFGDYDAARRLGEALSRRAPSLGTLARVASLREIQGDLPGAIAAMEQACAHADAQASAGTAAWCHVRLGAMHLERCDAERAEREYERAVERQPGFPLAREHIAELRAARGERAAAADLYRDLLADTGDPKYRMALADLHQLGGRGDEAAEERRAAIVELRRLYEGGSNAQLPALAAALLDDEATASEGLRLAEADWRARRDFLAADALAIARLKNGRVEEAREAIDQALAPGVRAPSLLVHAGAIYAASGERDRARAFLQAALACPLALWPLEREEGQRAAAALAH